MLESKLQEKIIKKFIALGFLCVKVDASRRGWPDLTAVLPGGVVLFLEIKQETGRLSPHQIRVHEQLRELGANVYVIRRIEEIDTILANLDRGPAAGD